MPQTQDVPPEKLSELLSGVDPDQLGKIMPLAGGGVITMMFTDIVDSTRVKAEVGDRPYFAALDIHHALLRERLAQHNGRELKTIGDSFFIGFTDPAAAVRCGSDIQQALAGSPIIVAGQPLAVRIGAHTGTPIVYRDKVSGRTDLSGTDVDKAARVEGIARGGQVLISEQTRILARGAATHDWGIWELKGLGGQRVYEVLYPGRQAEMPAGRMAVEALRFGTSFVGRVREVEALVEAVKRDRMVTLTGMGGIGKTRLADAAARRLSDSFEDGTYFVELATTADSEGAVVSALLEASKTDPAGFPNEEAALMASLRHKHALIVLDNFEAMMAASGLVRRLYLNCPRLHLLITSQSPLGIDGEHIHRADPMGTPAPTDDTASLADLDAFELFGERAEARVAGWKLQSAADETAVADILRLTDGIPLAIELAAAWVGSQSLQEIKDGLGQRRSALLQRRRKEGNRHDSIDACLDYSFDRLPDDAKALLPKLSVFAGGWFADDAGAVCGAPDAGRLLIDLHERNLLIRHETLGRSRYSMLVTVQEYARSRLAAKAARRLGQAHLAHFQQVASAARAVLGGSNYTEALTRLSIDLANIEAAIAHAQERGYHGAILGFAFDLADYLGICGRHAQRLTLAQAARDAAGHLETTDAASADVCLGAIYNELPTGDRSENQKRAIKCYEAALRVYTEADSPQDWAMTQNNLGNAYSRFPTGDRGDNQRRAIECYEAALRVWNERDFPQDWARLQTNLGTVYRRLPVGNHADNLRRAIECYEAALRVLSEHDFPHNWAAIQNNLGVAYANLPAGDPSDTLRRAIQHYEAALRVRTECDFPEDWARTLHNLGNSYAQLPKGNHADNLSRAVGCYEAAERGFRTVGLADEAERAKAAAKALGRK